MFRFCLLLLAAPMVFAAQVTIRVTSAADALPHDVYLAIAADDQPWTRAAQETVAPAGSVTWQVPAGTWRALAIASGYAEGMSDAFTVADGVPLDVPIRLERLNHIDGFVTAQGGHPVGNAAVTRSGNETGQLTRLGEEHRRANSTATTSEKGAFTALIPRSGSHMLVVEARGYAPAIIDAATLAHPPQNVVSLTPGASLRVSWAADTVQRSEKVSLLPIDAALPTGLTRERAASMWTRPVAEARWDSLPAGTYQLVLRTGTSGSDAPPPAGLAEVVLAPGDDRVLRAELPAAPSAAAAPARAIRIVVSDAPAGETLRLWQWRDGTREELHGQTGQVAGGTLLAVDARCGAGTVIVVESKSAIGSISPDDDCGETRRLSLAPRADLTAQVTAPRGMAIPRGGVLHLAKCPGVPAAAAIPFSVTGGRIDAPAIAGCGEASLHFSGFVPLAVHGPIPDARAAKSLGALALVHGAAAALRVRSARDAEPQAGVRITAVRARDLAAARKELELERIGIGIATTDAAGWARISGLPEEHVVFVLQAPGRAFPQVSEPYELPAGEETLVDDLRLEVPSRVFVTVSVPKEIEGAVELDRVELYASGHSHWPAGVPLRGLLAPSGAVVEDVPHGTWRVNAAGRLKNGFVIKAAETTIDVLPGADANVTLNITDRLYHGRVRRGGAAVSGVLNLKPEQRAGGRRAAVAPVTADGRFEVLLEDDGLYSVRLQESTGGGVTLDRWIAFDDPEKEIAIELPDGRVTGRVVDSSGAPVPNVLVSGTQQVATPTGGVFARNTADGRFVLESVAAGNWELVAESDAGRSEPVVLAFDDGQLDGVTLLLEPTSTIRIHATDVAGGPVSGAFIAAEFLGARAPVNDLRTTNAQGLAQFRVTRAQQATPINLTVVTSDSRLSCALRRLDSDQTIVVPQSTGEVRLIGREWRAREGVRSWLVSSSGCAVPFIGTRDERESDGGTAKVFPRLAAGTWSFVETHTVEQHQALITGGAPRLMAIKTFTVQPGRTTTVLLPGGADR
jgi:hypothetical protein